MRAVQGTDGKWYVFDQNNDLVEGPFDTEEEALNWIDQNTNTPTGPRPSP